MSEYEAAVIQLRQGDRKSLLRFFSVIILIGIMVGFGLMVTVSVPKAVYAVMGVSNE